MYLSEIGIQVSTVKKWLIELGKPISKIDEEINDEYINILREIQIENGLGNDGIFGYRTLNKLNELRQKKI